MPFRNGGRLLICRDCGAALSPADEQWLAEIAQIYDAYRVYHQSGGVEQFVADPETGTLRRRSEVLLGRLCKFSGLPQTGNVLDIGCGNGGTLRAFAERGGWRLNGLEMDDRSLPALREIAGFETLYTCEPADLPAAFDLVTMVHALEHFPEPGQTLRDLRGKIAAGGRLFIEVPNAEENPFDYLVADHRMHFSPATLTWLVEEAGWTVDTLAVNWVSKEISLVARPEQRDGCRRQRAAERVAEQVAEQVAWLSRLIVAARETLAGSESFGLFGTSIAATWLAGMMGDDVSFFVDEDSNRIGRTHMGKPIVGPAGVPAGGVVFVALIPQIAERIAGRLGGMGIDMRLPPS
jgi:SAM-dependent methyltransferase